MKRAKTHRSQRLKLVLTIFAALAGSAVLMTLSRWTSPALPAGASSRPTSTAPSDPAPFDPAISSAQNLSGILMLFGLACLLVAAVFVILLVIDIRRSRPAWKTQQKYPKHR